MADCPECAYRGGSHTATCPRGVERRNDHRQPNTLREGETRDDMGHAARNAAQLALAKRNKQNGEKAQTMSKSADFAIDKLAELKILKRTQAEAYVLREIERVPRSEAADRLNISKSALDNRVQTAKGRLTNAKKTVQFIEDLGVEVDA